MTEEDAAWVRVVTPLPATALTAWVQADAERLLRLNPHYEIDRFADGRLDGRNLATGRPLAATVSAHLLADGLRLIYGDGLKASTRFQVEPRPDGGADLVVTDDYGRLTPGERQARLDEVDRSLIPWGNALYRHLRAHRRWGRLRPWQWWMARVWLPMTPKARRLTALVTLVTLAEFAAFLMVFTIYWLEQQRG